MQCNSVQCYIQYDGCHPDRSGTVAHTKGRRTSGLGEKIDNFFNCLNMESKPLSHNLVHRIKLPAVTSDSLIIIFAAPQVCNPSYLAENKVSALWTWSVKCNRAVHCNSAVQCNSVVQCSVVQCNAVQCNAVQCSVM